MDDRKYHIYKRGSIVLVDFPSGIGNELNGKHLAIVLTKNDSIKNGVLTVIPLSSKEKPYYLEMGNLVKEVIGPELFNKTKELSDRHDKLAETSDQIKTKINILYGKAQHKENKEEVRKELPTISKEFQEYIEENDKFKENFNQFEKVVNIYLKMNKGSFALVQNITTISKLRILKPINKLDPIGKIKLPNELMDKIDAEIMRMFTK